MAHSLKLEVIAEGVETVLQKDFLKQNNCNIAQGFLFSPPISYDDFCDLLDGQKKVKHQGQLTLGAFFVVHRQYL